MAPRSVESGSPGMDAMRKAVARADLPPVAVPPVPGEPIADPDQPHNEKRDPKVPFLLPDRQSVAPLG